MAKQFGRVVEGAVVEGPLPLPYAWRNISGLDNLSRKELRKLGWYPVNVVCQGCDPEDLVYTFIEESNQILGTLPSALLPNVIDELKEQYKEDLDKKLNRQAIRLKTCEGITYKFTTGFYDIAAWAMATIIGGAHVAAYCACDPSKKIKLVYIRAEDAQKLMVKYEARRASQIFTYLAQLERLSDVTEEDDLDDVVGKARYVVEVCEELKVKEKGQNPKTQLKGSNTIIETLSPRDSIRLPVTHERSVMELIGAEDQAVQRKAKKREKANEKAVNNIIIDTVIAEVV